MLLRFFKQRARVFIVFLAVLLTCVGRLSAAEALSKQDVMLLVLSGATAEKKSELIQRRGISFQMSPSITNELAEVGAEEPVLRALDAATAHRSPFPASSVILSAQTETAPKQSTPHASNDRRIATKQKLARPNHVLINYIVQKLIRADEAFRLALNNYTYHQIVLVKQFDKSGRVVGVYHREWDNVFDDKGRQISRLTYAAPSNLRRIRITDQDAQYFQQTLFLTEFRDGYDFRYLDHVHVDKISAYVFSVTPKKMEPGKHYFEGTIWVDDEDLQVVKADGRRVPAVKTAENGVIRETLFPRFVEYRQQIDGKYWFPTVDFSDETLQFAFGPVHVQVLVEYAKYKAFGAESHVMSSMSEIKF